MNLPDKIYTERYDRYNKTHWTTVYTLLELFDLFESCILFILDKGCDWLKRNTSTEEKK